jgi:hypothetical protein
MASPRSLTAHPLLLLFSAIGVMFGIVGVARRSAQGAVTQLASALQFPLQGALVGLVAGGLVLMIWRPRVARRILEAALVVLGVLVASNVLTVLPELMAGEEISESLTRAVMAGRMAVTGVGVGVVAALLATTIEELRDEPD